MAPLINTNVDKLIKLFDKHVNDGRPFDIYRYVNVGFKSGVLKHLNQLSLRYSGLWV